MDALKLVTDLDSINTTQIVQGLERKSVREPISQLNMMPVLSFRYITIGTGGRLPQLSLDNDSRGKKAKSN